MHKALIKSSQNLRSRQTIRANTKFDTTSRASTQGSGTRSNIYQEGVSHPSGFCAFSKFDFDFYIPCMTSSSYTHNLMGDGVSLVVFVEANELDAKVFCDSKKFFFL